MSTNQEVFAPPFAIGQTLWMPVGEAEKNRQSCPVCAGQLAVVVILGSGEHVGVPCDACGHGFDGPRGYIEEYEQHPRAAKFVIASIESFHNGVWCLRSETGAWHELNDLYATEAEALDVAVKRAAEQHERNMQSRQHKRQSAQRHGWSIQYHRSCIKDLERQLDWHRAHVLSKQKGKP